MGWFVEEPRVQLRSYSRTWRSKADAKEPGEAKIYRPATALVSSARSVSLG
jgi:hypothetical protein